MRDWRDNLADLSLPSEAWGLIEAEDERQKAKWGIQCHSPAEWLMFLTEEVGELAEAIADFWFRDGDYESMQAEAVQVATLAIKIAWMVKCSREDAEEEAKK